MISGWLSVILSRYETQDVLKTAAEGGERGEGGRGEGEVSPGGPGELIRGGGAPPIISYQPLDCNPPTLAQLWPGSTHTNEIIALY